VQRGGHVAIISSTANKFLYWQNVTIKSVMEDIIYCIIVY
jgi:hypothetical protein